MYLRIFSIMVNTSEDDLQHAAFHVAICMHAFLISVHTSTLQMFTCVQLTQTVAVRPSDFRAQCQAKSDMLSGATRCL